MSNNTNQNRPEVFILIENLRNDAARWGQNEELNNPAEGERLKKKLHESEELLIDYLKRFRGVIQ